MWWKILYYNMTAYVKYKRKNSAAFLLYFFKVQIVFFKEKRKKH